MQGTKQKTKRNANDRFLGEFIGSDLFETDTPQNGIYRLARLADETGLESVLCRVPRPIEKPTERFLFLAMNWTRFALHSEPQRTRRKSLTDQAFAIRNWIIAANQGLVYDLARKLSNSATQREELTGEGWFPLMRACELFDAGRGCRFSTYATHAIRNHLLRVLHRRKPVQATTSDGDDLLQNVADGHVETESRALRIDRLSREAVQAINELPIRQRKILQEYFGLTEGERPQSYTRIADEIGLSKERVRQIAIEGLETVRGQMTGSLQVISG